MNEGVEDDLILFGDLSFFSLLLLLLIGLTDQLRSTLLETLSLPADFPKEINPQEFLPILLFLLLWTCFMRSLSPHENLQGNFCHSDQKVSCGYCSLFLRKVPQEIFLRFLKSSGNNYPRRYYLGVLIFGRRKGVFCGIFTRFRRKIRRKFERFY
ncbi:transmembrane protein, putative [Medicago truncatula]|uniref:Transmembrane protein, putative n=1 Tax=Medicago truncatula TaxID=3880 RepID=G7KNA6_MEDTR|nr:transmembrane protein, putative [Medicago truncatula]